MIPAMRCEQALSSCPICKSPVRPLMRKHDFHYSQCTHCNFIFVNPRPEANELAEWYRSHSSFRKHQGAKDLLEWSGTNPQKYERKILNELKPSGRVLDIGCGYGYNILLFQQYGLECHGIEPDIVAAEDCFEITGVKPFVGTFEDYQADAKFDMIFLNQVIEHVLDPRAWIKKIRNLLTPVGVAVFGTPNATGFYTKILGRQRDPFYHAPLHLNHFTPDNLSDLLEQCGMKSVLVRKFSDLGPVSFKRSPSQPRWTAYALWQAHRPIAGVFDAMGWGLLMYVVAKPA